MRSSTVGRTFRITKGGETAFLPVRRGFKLGQHPAFGQWLMAFNDIAGDQECDSGSMLPSEASLTR